MSRTHIYLNKTAAEIVESKDAEIASLRAELAATKRELNDAEEARAELASTLDSARQDAQTIRDYIAWVKSLQYELLQDAEEKARLREALTDCAESLSFARERLGMCGEGDGKDRKADASDDIGSLAALTEARAALACRPQGEKP